jgi:hypothetical protein
MLFTKRVGLMPLWMRATFVILAGILLSVWFTAEATRRLDEKFLLGEMRTGVQRSAGLLAGLLSESLVTGDHATADATVKQYVSTWPQVTFVHVTDAGGAYFTEWQQHPIKFGEGILKFEEPIRFGRQDFGTLSLYVNLQDPLRSIRTHVLASQRREALSLLALALLIVAMASYAALQPFREMGDRAAGLLSQRGALKAAESGDETQRLRAALDLLQKMLEKK